MAEDMTGTVGENEYKQEGSKQPDYKGKATVGGVDYVIAGWKRVNGSDGKTFLSLKYTTKAEDDARKAAYKANQAGGAPAAPAAAAQPAADKIPF